ncbi:MAG: endolytic transglycosylase MltG [Minisyncoccota bacterium]
MDAFRQYVQAVVSAFKSSVRRYPRRWAAALALIALLGGYCLTLAPPADFSQGSTVIIAHGASASLVAQTLADAHIIAHPELLRFILRLSGAGNQAQAGVYRFDSPENLFVVAYRLVTGAYGIPPIRITFSEGMSVREMAMQIASTSSSISAKDFLVAGKPYEGYLFPDTYFFPPSADAASAIATMRSNFDAKIAPLSDEMRSSGRSLSDIITLASLVEKEARTTTNRRIVAGILLNRLRLGMPLQVDAVFGYIYGRDTYSPSFADLTVNSPHNTYTHVGLPPGPIDNPGLDSIEAALNPTKTNYLYYLTGKDGLMHYATTYSGHQANQRKYLN